MKKFVAMALASMMVLSAVPAMAVPIMTHLRMLTETLSQEQIITGA